MNVTEERNSEFEDRSTLKRKEQKSRTKKKQQHPKAVEQYEMV